MYYMPSIPILVEWKSRDSRGKMGNWNSHFPCKPLACVFDTAACCKLLLLLLLLLLPASVLKVSALHHQ